MENKFKITIPKPCHEDWNAMTPEENGRFCSVCTKDVVDFTNKTTEEIQEYFIQNKGQKICGRFKNEQVSRFDIQIPKSVLQQQMSFHKAFLLILFIVMGSTLFSCKSHNDASLGEVSVVEDTVIKVTKLPHKESLNEEPHLMGDISPECYDSLVKKGFVATPPPLKVVKDSHYQTNVPKATLGISVVEPLVDSTKTEKK